jgi:hypothetical protein
MNGLNLNGNFPTGLAIGGVLVLYLGILVLLLLFAIFTAVVAGKKGRNAFGWFFIGLFTGIVGLAIALAILPKKYYVNDELNDF